MGLHSNDMDIRNKRDQSLQLQLQQLDEMDYLCVAVAGLCHDLGMQLHYQLSVVLVGFAQCNS